MRGFILETRNSVVLIGISLLPSSPSRIIELHKANDVCLEIPVLPTSKLAPECDIKWAAITFNLIMPYH